MKLIRALLVIVALGSANPVKSQSYYLDHSFGKGGSIAGLSVTPNSRVNDIEVQTNGRIVGTLYNNQKFHVFRLLKNGDPDPSFGTNGFVEMLVTAQPPNSATSLAIQLDGKILVAGIAHRQDNDVAIVRFNIDGTLDQGFGQDGIVLTNTCTGCDEDVQKLLLRPDGRILIAGRKDEPGEKTKELLIQYNTDGTLDNSFGNNGFVSGGYEGNGTSLESAALQADGKIVTTGYTYIGQVSNADISVARYNADGSVDMSFGENADGKVIRNYVAAAMEDGRKVMIQSTGKIVIACYAPQLFFLTFRLKADGTTDASYGRNGVSALNLNLSDFSFDAMLAAGNEIIIGGNVEVAGVYDFNIVKLDKNGNNKYTFGVNGKITTDVFGYTDYLFSLALQRDGKIIAAGSSIQNVAGLPYPSMVRYIANPVNSVAEIVNTNTLQIYPNPNNGSITINGEDAAVLYISNISGQLLRTVELNSANKYTTTVTDLPQGINLIRSSDGKIFNKILTVQK